MTDIPAMELNFGSGPIPKKWRPRGGFKRHAVGHYRASTHSDDRSLAHLLQTQDSSGLEFLNRQDHTNVSKYPTFHYTWVT